MFKIYGSGNQLTNDVFNNTIEYDTIEQLDENDFVHYLDIGRPIRNLYENEYESYLEFKNINNKAFTSTFGIINNAIYGNNFLLTTNDTIKVDLKITSPATESQYYAKMPTGIAFTQDGTFYVNKPRTDILERQLFKVLKMYDKDNEYVRIKYDTATGKFKARVAKIYLERSTSIIETIKMINFGCASQDESDFTSESYANGYLSSVSLLEAIANYEEANTFKTYFMSCFKDAIGELNGGKYYPNFTKLVCEPIVKLTPPINATYYWKISSTGSLVVDTSPAGVNDIGIGHALINTGGTLMGTPVDDRVYYTISGTLKDLTLSGTSLLAQPVTTVSLATTALTGTTINIGSAATTSGTKAINIGTSGTSNSTTTITIGTITGLTPTITVNGATTINGTLALGSNSLTMTGSLAASGNRITKGWFTDIDVTNFYLANFALRDTSAAFDVILKATSSPVIDANRTLTLNMGNASNSLVFTGASVVTFPVGTNTLMALGTADIVTGIKTFDNSTIKIKGSSTGTTTLTSGNSSASNYVLTIPAVTGTIALEANTHYIGTTSIALNRASAELVLTGITGVASADGTSSSGVSLASGTASSTTTGTITIGSGNATTTSGNVNISTGTGTTSGNITIDVGNGSGADGTINIGTSNASMITISNASTTAIKLAKLTTNGFVKTSSADGTLIIDTNSYLVSGSSSPSFTGTTVMTYDDASTNTVLFPIELVRTVNSGNGADNIGTGIKFTTETGGGNNRTGTTLESIATSSTNGAENFDFVIKTMAAGAAAAERVRFTSDGKIKVGGYSTIANNSTNAVAIVLPSTAGTLVGSGDTGTVTNTMLAGSIANNKLANSSITVGGSTVSLGSSTLSLSGLTTLAIRDTSAAYDVIIAATSTTPFGADKTLTIDMNNSSNTLKFTAASTITFPSGTKTLVATDGSISGSAGSVTNALSAGTGLVYSVGSAFNGSAATTFAVDTTAAGTPSIYSTLTTGSLGLAAGLTTGQVNIANGATALGSGSTTAVNILSGAMTVSGSGTRTLNIGNNGTANLTTTINIGTGASASSVNNINIGTASLTTITINGTFKLGTSTVSAPATIALPTLAAIGDIPYASSTTALGVITAVATGSLLASAGTGTKPTWSSSPTLTTSLTVPSLLSAAAGTAVTLYDSVLTTGTISMASALTTGQVNIANGTAFTSTTAAVNIMSGAGTSATRTINIGANGNTSLITNINIGTTANAGTGTVTIGSVVTGNNTTIKGKTLNVVLDTAASTGFLKVAATTGLVSIDTTVVTNNGISTVSGTTKTLALVDIGYITYFTSGSAVSVTIPTNASVAFPIGTVLDFIQAGAGKVTFSGSGVTINSKDSNKSMGAQWVGATLVKIDTDTWNLLGDLIA